MICSIMIFCIKNPFKKEGFYTTFFVKEMMVFCGDNDLFLVLSRPPFKIGEHVKFIFK